MADSTIPVCEIKNDFDRHISKNWDDNSISKLVLDYEGNLLVYLNEYLFAKENNTRFNFGSKCDIEHIMPASGANIDEIWRDANFDDKEEFKSSVDKLGNKILLEEKINRGIGNAWFRTKVSTKISAKTGYIDSNYPIAKSLVNRYRTVNKPHWTKEDIENATLKASERIVRFIFGDE